MHKKHKFINLKNIIIFNICLNKYGIEINYKCKKQKYRKIN